MLGFGMVAVTVSSVTSFLPISALPERVADAAERSEAPNEASNSRQTCAAMSFLQLGVSPSLARRLVAIGLQKPTSIQTAALPIVLSGEDVVVTAETGSGKTAIYATPVMERVYASREGTKPLRPINVILAPSHELCKQIDRVFRSIDDTVRPTVLHRRSEQLEVEESLHRKSDGIIIGTPALVYNVELRGLMTACGNCAWQPLCGLQSVTAGELRPPAVGLVGVDEADMLLTGGFIDDVSCVVSFV
jgi:superfamily II DNA/RNA helicase